MTESEETLAVNVEIKEEEQSKMIETSPKSKRVSSYRHQTATLDALSSSELNLYEHDRPALTEKDLREKYNFEKFKPENALHSSVRYVSKRYKPSGNCLMNFILDRLPILRWIQAYHLRENILKDFIAGVTIGVVHIPQGMAYSLVAGLPAVYGLYVSLFPVFIYAILGTSHHLSTGTFAITSIMTFSAISKLEGKYYPSIPELKINHQNTSIVYNYQSSTSAPPNYLSNDPTEAKIKIRQVNSNLRTPLNF
jgi:hypothetical protein